MEHAASTGNTTTQGQVQQGQDVSKPGSPEVRKASTKESLQQQQHELAPVEAAKPQTEPVPTKQPELSLQQSDTLHDVAAVDPVVSLDGHSSSILVKSTEILSASTQQQPHGILPSEGEPHHPATNGKKKAPRGKVKRLKLVRVMPDHVVKCELVTSAGQVVNFQFSMEYDKPQEIFQKFVSCV